MTKMKIPVPIAPTVKLGLAWSSGLMRREKGVDLLSQSCGSFPRESIGRSKNAVRTNNTKPQKQNEHNVGCAEIRVSKLGFLPPSCNYLRDMSEYVDYRVEKKIPCTKIRVSKLGFLPPFWNTYLEMFNLWILQGRKKKKNLRRYDK